MSDHRSFFAELKRRNVYKVAVAYAVVGWLLVQVATQVFPFFEIPNWAVRLIVLVIIIGFPIALILAWAFELTPEGIKRTDEVKVEKSKGRAWIYVAVIAAALSLGLFFLGRFSAPNNPAASAEVSSKSIAVLPFENLSEEKSNAYFAEGIQDEILTRLSKIGTLKVISRTSTAHYASSPQNLPEIAKQLGVASVLEGSVQKVNDAVRINVQLIRAATDDHLWAESYDRKLTDIFGVEAEVAQSIASTLNARLTGAEQQMLAQKPTSNPAAYDAYLRGSVQVQTLNPEGVKAATQSFDEAVRLDPQFSLAWAALSEAHSRLFFMAEATSARRAAAEKALAEAIRLQPQLPETQSARAYLQYYVQNDKKGARELLLQLHGIWPNNADILESLGAISARLGDWRGSLSYLNQAIELSPRDRFLRRISPTIPFAMRDFTTTLRMLDDALQIWPGDVELLGLKASAFQTLGQLDKAQSIVAGLKPGDQDQFPISVIFEQARLRREPAKALPFFQSLASRSKESDDYWSLWNSLLFAELQQMAGDSVGARSSFAKIGERAKAALQEQPDNPNILSFLARALFGLGERDAALKANDQALAVSADDARIHPNVEEQRARILAHFGPKDDAIAILQTLLTTPYDGALTPALLRLDPDFDALRSDPRFQKLCEEKAP
jgi:TolB-like protein/cytochrome c-type biogenesis protein CcmH/NrfG